MKRCTSIRNLTQGTTTVAQLAALPPKPCIRLSYPPYALHAQPNAFFSILSPKRYWVSTTAH